MKDEAFGHIEKRKNENSHDEVDFVGKRRKRDHENNDGEVFWEETKEVSRESRFFSDGESQSFESSQKVKTTKQLMVEGRSPLRESEVRTVHRKFESSGPTRRPKPRSFSDSRARTHVHARVCRRMKRSAGMTW